MSNTIDESEDDTLSRNHSELSFSDDGSPTEMAGTGVVLKKGPWTAAEDAILAEYVNKHGEGNWNAVQKHSGLFRCGKSCRLRWANHLKPNLKKGAFTAEEERVIIELHAKMGNKWARMAAHLPGRTDNEIKNYWNTRIKRRQRAGLPLYPAEMCLAMQDNQSHNSSGFHNGEKRHHSLLQSNEIDIPDCVRGILQANQALMNYVPQPSNIPFGRLLVKSPTPSQYCSFMPPTMHCQKRFRQSMPRLAGYDADVSLGIPQFEQIQDGQRSKIEEPVGFSFPPDPTRMYHPPFGITQGSHSLGNGNFSASKLSPGAVKSELPSLQYAEAEFEQIQDDQRSKIEEPVGLSFPPDPDPTRMYHPPFGITQGSHFLGNGNFSASKLSPGAVKSELPSLQYAEADLGSWGRSIAAPLPESADAFIQSPPSTGELMYECSSPRSSGLLEALLYQANTIDNANNLSSDIVLDSYTVTPSDLASHRPTQNLGDSEQRYHESIPQFIFSESEPSIFSECTPIIGAGIPLDEQTPAEAFAGESVKSEPVDNPVWSPDKDMDEAFPSSNWFEEENSFDKDESINTIATVLGGDCRNDYSHMSPEPSSSSQGQGQGQDWGFGFPNWSNMPSAHQMYNFP